MGSRRLGDRSTPGYAQASTVAAWRVPGFFPSSRLVRRTKASRRVSYRQQTNNSKWRAQVDEKSRARTKNKRKGSMKKKLTHQYLCVDSPLKKIVWRVCGRSLQLLWTKSKTFWCKCAKVGSSCTRKDAWKQRKKSSDKTGTVKGKWRYKNRLVKVSLKF